MKMIFVILALALFPSVADAQQRRRDVALEGAVNFRDLGGYLATDYRSTLRGRVYRAGDLSNLTDADMEELKRRKVYSVIDFRAEDEAAAAPARILPGADYLLLPAGSVDLSGMLSLAADHPTGRDAMAAFYSDVSYFREKFRPLFVKLMMLPDTSALVFHCSTGKDHAGIAAALFLHILDIPMGTIMADYLLSNQLRAVENQTVIERLESERGVERETAAEIMNASPFYLESMFGALRRQHGSIDAFLYKELGITETVKYRFREKFLQ